MEPESTDTGLNPEATDAAGSGPTGSDANRKDGTARSFMIVFNISKKANFGFLIRTANAFGAELICIGRRSYSAGGAVPGTRHTKVHRFYTLDEGIEFARSVGCSIAGIEISKDSKSIWDQPFQGPTAFMVGNEGQGLSQRQIEMCDYLVQIPQYGDGASINVNVAAGIVLGHFAHWAGYRPNEVLGHKFYADEPDE